MAARIRVWVRWGGDLGLARWRRGLACKTTTDTLCSIFSVYDDLDEAFVISGQDLHPSLAIASSRSSAYSLRGRGNRRTDSDHLPSPLPLPNPPPTHPPPPRHLQTQCQRPEPPPPNRDHHFSFSLQSGHPEPPPPNRNHHFSFSPQPSRRRRRVMPPPSTSNPCNSECDSFECLNSAGGGSGRRHGVEVHPDVVPVDVVEVHVHEVPVIR